MKSRVRTVRFGFRAAGAVGAVGLLVAVAAQGAAAKSDGRSASVAGHKCLVMTGSGRFVEIQGTAEGIPFSRSQMDALVTLGENGARELIAAQKKVLALE